MKFSFVQLLENESEILSSREKIIMFDNEIYFDIKESLLKGI